MATIKAFTDLEQSKKLAEILPLESADMCYNDGELRIGYTPLAMERDNYLPCWSLAALLEIIKNLVGYSLQSIDTRTVFMICGLRDKSYCIETENYQNSIDACYEMILKLNKPNLL